MLIIFTEQLSKIVSHVNEVEILFQKKKPARLVHKSPSNVCVTKKKSQVKMKEMCVCEGDGNRSTGASTCKPQ